MRYFCRIMQVYRELSTYTENKPLALSLGMFDGVHLGHQCIIQALCNAAEIGNLQSAILTFWPHPRLIFNPNEELKLLNTLDEKSALLAEFGIQKLFIQQFDYDFRNLTGEEFVQKILVEKLNVKYLIVGYDHVFGKNKSGNYSLLQQLAPKSGFEVIQMEAVNRHDKNISSTKIRNALQKANIKEANEMLGYHYSISGEIIHGRKIGRTIGFPTANIKVDEIKLLPKNGAYIVEVEVKNKIYKGMLSIGTNPTIDIEEKIIHTEVYILDFDENIYGEKIMVKFHEFLHDEIAFNGMDNLITKLQEDKTQTENFFKNLN